MSCFNMNDTKTSALLEELKDKFTVNIKSGYTLLVFVEVGDVIEKGQAALFNALFSLK